MTSRGGRLPLAVLVMGVTLVASGRASAQEASCSYDSASHSVRIQTAPGPPEANYFGQWTLHLLGDEIRFDGKPCQGGATLTNTDSISVTGIPVGGEGASGHEALFITGMFAPGVSPEPDGEPEIEISVDFGNAGDTLGVWGTDGDNQMTVGTLGVAVNADLDLDIVVQPTSSVFLTSEGGKDRLSALGGNGSGGPSETGVSLEGGRGSDQILGGANLDALIGEAGSDLVVAGAGDDLIKGGGGNDRLKGGRGRDLLVGGDGRDWCGPGPGKDKTRMCERPAKLFGGEGVARP
jgi:Ca2+-binding RTX toxin-like protein